MNWLFSPILLISVLLSSLTVFDQLIRDHVPVLIRLSCYKIPLAYTTPHYRQPGHRRAVQSATLRVACSFPLSLVYSRDQLVSRLEPKTRDVSAAIHRSCKIACASSLLRARVWQMRSAVASESTWLQMSQRESQLIRSFTRLFVWIGLWRSGSSFFIAYLKGRVHPYRVCMLYEYGSWGCSCCVLLNIRLFLFVVRMGNMTWGRRVLVLVNHTVTTSLSPAHSRAQGGFGYDLAHNSVKCILVILC